MLGLGNERLKISEQRQTSGCSYLIFFSIFKVILSRLETLVLWMVSWGMCHDFFPPSPLLRLSTNRINLLGVHIDLEEN